MCSYFKKNTHKPCRWIKWRFTVVTDFCWLTCFERLLWKSVVVTRQLLVSFHQAARLHEDIHNMGSLYMSEICTEMKNLRSLVRVCEIQATLREQRWGGQFSRDPQWVMRLFTLHSYTYFTPPPPPLFTESCFWGSRAKSLTSWRTRTPTWCENLSGDKRTAVDWNWKERGLDKDSKLLQPLYSPLWSDWGKPSVSDEVELLSFFDISSLVFVIKVFFFFSRMSPTEQWNHLFTESHTLSSGQRGREVKQHLYGLWTFVCIVSGLTCFLVCLFIISRWDKDYNSLKTHQLIIIGITYFWWL